MLCADSLVKPKASWLTRSEQILGRFTSPMGTSPIKYEINLPMVPNCTAVDIDNNGKGDNGVQLLMAVNGLNLFGDSFLEQVEQESFYGSILVDPKSNTIRRGTLLIYSPDNSQKVPMGFGPDKRLFTSDDPTVAVPAGYSLMKISEDRSIAINSSGLPPMDILEPQESAEADFSSKGILGSFDALIDFLKKRYAYTELRKIDWEKKRADFRPRFADADRRNDLGDYYLALYELAASMKDGHVQTGTYSPEYAGKRLQILTQRFQGTLGAEVIRFTDGRFVVTAVGKNSPAEKEGFKTGTEILRVNGRSPLEHVNLLPALGFYGTEEGFIRRASANFFSFPSGESVQVEYRQPGDTRVRTATLVAGEFESGDGFPGLDSFEPIQIKNVGEGKFGYFRWANFENVNLDIAGLETLLERSKGSKGVILDLRSNTGGLLSLMYAMASYFIEEDKPASLDWLDTYRYDDLRNDFVKPPKGVEPTNIFSPRKDLTFTGPVVILVNANSASAAEFFSQFLQRQGRATVIADSGTDGAGGIVQSVLMPGAIPFTFTAGRTYFAGTKEVNLEGKGVIPDVRVPIDDQYVERRLKGEDVVLSEAIKYLLEKTSAK